jgi:pyruvate kinase
MTTQLTERPSRTKIVATLGPASDGEVMIERLILAGVDVFRLNMAHGGQDAQSQRLSMIRKVSDKLGQPVAVLADLAGPKIRLGELPGGHYQCNKGELVRFIRGTRSDVPGEFACTYGPLIDELKEGDRIMLADGTVALRVEEKKESAAVCRIIQSGLVRSRQGVNLPGVRLSIPTLQSVDIENAIWAAKNGIDFLGLSFVRTAEDILDLKRIIAEQEGNAQVIAKIEKPEALENLESVVQAADGLMVARGDLGVETDIAKIAVVQKEIIAACRRHGKPVITATQMLDSMQHESLPTRAEATDVANAVLDGSDACMLSGETAIGEYPVEAVEMMHRIALATEQLDAQRPKARDTIAIKNGGQNLEADRDANEGSLDRIMLATIEAAGGLAEQIEASAILVAGNGRSALYLSKQRRPVHTIGISASTVALRRMALYWGVIPVPNVSVDDLDAAYDKIARQGLDSGLLAKGDRIVVLDGAKRSQERRDSITVRIAID